MYEFDDDYIREVNAAYWAEESEMTDGTHPSQILERVRNELDKTGVTGDITFMDYGISGSRVMVSVNGSVYGIFDYEDNLFQNTPEKRLNNILEGKWFRLIWKRLKYTFQVKYRELHSIK